MKAGNCINCDMGLLYDFIERDVPRDKFYIRCRNCGIENEIPQMNTDTNYGGKNGASDTTVKRGLYGNEYR